MNYDIIITDECKDDIKYYVRKRKCAKIFNDIDDITKLLEQGIFLGDTLKSLDNKNTYKVRMVDSSNGIGKRGGFRIIYCIKQSVNEVYLLMVYHKRELLDADTVEIQNLIDKYIND